MTTRKQDIRFGFIVIYAGMMFGFLAARFLHDPIWVAGGAALSVVGLYPILLSFHENTDGSEKP